METATKMSPVSAAEAPAWAEKNVDQAAGLNAAGMWGLGERLPAQRRQEQSRRKRGRLLPLPAWDDTLNACTKIST
jgi:hypothetical protein